MGAIVLKSLLVTLLVELTAALLVGLRQRDSLLTVALMNAATNPPLVFAVTLARKFWQPTSAGLLFGGLELFAWAAEAFLLSCVLGLGLRRAVVCSAALNGASLVVGMLL